MKIPATACAALFLAIGAFTTPASASCSYVIVDGTTYGPLCPGLPPPTTCVDAGDPSTVFAHVCVTKFLGEHREVAEPAVVEALR